MPKGRSAPGNVSPAYVLSSGARPAFVPTKTLTRSAALLLGAAEVPAGGAGAAAAGAASEGGAADAASVTPDSTAATALRASERIRPAQRYRRESRSAQRVARRLLGIRVRLRVCRPRSSA